MYTLALTRTFLHLNRDEWLDEHGPESRSNAVIFDQLIAQPPRILFLYIALDVIRAGILEFPSAWKRSWSSVSPAVASSWTFWPVAVYVM